jgi:ribosome biogenesis GTPase
MSLQSLGWDSRLEQAFASFRDPGLAPGRVAREDRDRYLVLDGAAPRPAELAGRLRHEARSRAELPAVGDWVALRAEEGLGRILAVLPRATAFLRKLAGETTAEQVVAANMDTVFLVAGLDGDFNLRRIERYLAAAWESGATPVVVLNKCDLDRDPDSRVGEVEASAIGVPVVAISAREGRGLEALDRWLSPGRTVALLGSSGAGKSTLVNALVGDQRQATRSVREGDSRGRHTTTRRELVALPGGAWLIDTPGMRELQLWGDEDGIDDAFPDIAALAAGCRFRDCGHAGEPGCAVRAAVDRGALDRSRVESWRKLQRELQWLAARQDARAQAERQARWKAISKSMKHHPKMKRWDAR